MSEETKANEETVTEARDLPISELTGVTDRKDTDLFIISRQEGSAYTSYKQERRYAFDYSTAFQFANPVMKPVFMDHDPNVDSVYGGKKYWAKAGEKVSLTGDSVKEYYDELTRVKGFLGSELPGSSVQVQVRKQDGSVVSITCGRSASGLLFTADEGNANVIYNDTGVAWFYVVSSVTASPDWIMFPRTKWNFVGTRGSVGQYVAPGLPEHTHNVPVYKSQCGCNSSAGIRNSHAVNTTYYVSTKDTSDKAGIYGNSSTVQPPATEMGLWFAV